MQDSPQGLDLWLKILGVGGIAGIATWLYRLWRHAVKPLEKEVEEVKEDLREAKQTRHVEHEKLTNRVDNVQMELRKQDSDLRTAQTSLIKDMMKNEEEIKRTDTKVGRLDDAHDRTKEKVAGIDKELHGAMKDVENLKNKRRDDRTPER